MRIGFDAEVLTEPKTAAAHYLSKLIEHLIRLNPRLEIVLFSSDKICVDYEPYTHFPQIRRIPSGLSKRQRGRMWPSKVLPGLLREERIDLFHAPVVHDLPVFRPPCPSVVTIFDLAPWGMGGQGFWGSLRYRSRHLAWSRIARRSFPLRSIEGSFAVRKNGPVKFSRWKRNFSRVPDQDPLRAGRRLTRRSCRR